MAGMFYSLKETAARLGLTEQGVRQMSKEGRLREFRDGTHILFKIDEVEALLEELKAGQVQAEQAAEVSSDQQVDLEKEAAVEEGLQAEELESLFVDQPQGPAEAQAEEVSDVDQDWLLAEQSATDRQAQEAAEQASEEVLQDIGEQPVEERQAKEEAVHGPSDTMGLAGELSPEEEALLASETGVAGPSKDEAALDTTLTGEGVKVLGETDKGYQLTDDTLGETVAGLGGTGEASLEEIEKDVNLDTFGSGSGLLDLSLQADDTSLGGILDEIYTPEDQKEGAAPAAEPSGGALAADIAAETEQMPPAADLGLAPAPAVPMALPTTTEPDPAEGVVSGLLAISLVVAAYTLVATVSAHLFRTTPSLVVLTQQFIAYAAGGLALVALVLSAMIFLKGSGGPRTRPAKPKKQKGKKSQ